MKDYIIITDRDQLKALIQELQLELTPPVKEVVEEPKLININGLLALLAENGYTTTKAQIYKFTSSGTIPYIKFGNKLLFSKPEILEWIDAHKKIPRKTHKANQETIIKLKKLK